jgi:hypothetical protein
VFPQATPTRSIGMASCPIPLRPQASKALPHTTPFFLTTILQVSNSSAPVRTQLCGPVMRPFLKRRSDA